MGQSPSHRIFSKLGGVVVLRARSFSRLSVPAGIPRLMQLLQAPLGGARQFLLHEIAHRRQPQTFPGGREKKKKLRLVAPLAGQLPAATQATKRTSFREPGFTNARSLQVQAEV